jgi:hypothetical protein
VIPEDEAVQHRCPTCRGPLVCIGSRCQGPEPDGTFGFLEYPVCGSHETSLTPRSDGVEELVCGACGAITSVPIVPSSA